MCYSSGESGTTASDETDFYQNSQTKRSDTAMMELSAPTHASFELTTADTRIVCNPRPAYAGEAKVSLFTAPATGEASTTDWEYSIYELGEFELYSTFITNAPVASAKDDGTRSQIELVYSVSGSLTNLTIVGSLSESPTRKVIDAMQQSQNTNIMAIDLDYSRLATPQLADFIRKMDTKRLILRSPDDTTRLTALLKELDIAEPNRYNKTNLQTSPAKDTLTAIVLNQI